MDSEGTLLALQDERSVMSFLDLDVALNGRPMEGTPVLEPLEHSVLEMALDGRPMKGTPVLEPLEHSVLEMALDGGPIEGMPVLEPLEHSVLEMALDGGPIEGMPVLEPLEHSVLEMALDGKLMKEMSVLEPLEHLVLEVARNGRPMAGTSVLEPLEHSVPDVALVWGDCSLIKMTVLDPLEHSGLGVTDDVDLDPLWMAPWDAGVTLGTGSRPGMAILRDALCCVVRFSRMPVLPVTGYLRSFRGLGRTCIISQLGCWEIILRRVFQDRSFHLVA